MVAQTQHVEVPKEMLLGGMVFTTLGEVPLKDLDVRIVPQPETLDAWIYARECVYTGASFPDKRGEIVRRDVWVSMKRGQSAAGKGGL